jgi:hypothetical protein
VLDKGLIYLIKLIVLTKLNHSSIDLICYLIKCSKMKIYFQKLLCIGIMLIAGLVQPQTSYALQTHLNKFNMLAIAKPSTVLNRGGLVTLELCPVSDIASVKPEASWTQSSQVNFKTGGAWHKVYATIETMSFDSELENPRHGNSYPVKIIGQIPGSKLVKDVISKLAGHKYYIARIKDSNGVIRIVGDINTPLKFGFNQSTGSTLKNFNGYRFTLEGELERQPGMLLPPASNGGGGSNPTPPGDGAPGPPTTD